MTSRPFSGAPHLFRTQGGKQCWPHLGGTGRRRPGHREVRCRIQVTWQAVADAGEGPRASPVQCSSRPFPCFFFSSQITLKVIIQGRLSCPVSSSLLKLCEGLPCWSRGQELAFLPMQGMRGLSLVGIPHATEQLSLLTATAGPERHV